MRHSDYSIDGWWGYLTIENAPHVRQMVEEFLTGYYYTVLTQRPVDLPFSIDFDPHRFLESDNRGEFVSLGNYEKYVVITINDTYGVAFINSHRHDDDQDTGYHRGAYLGFANSRMIVDFMPGSQMQTRWTYIRDYRYTSAMKRLRELGEE